MYTPPNKTQSPYLPFGDKQDAPFYFTDILSVKQFQRKDLDYIFGVAHEMSEMVRRIGTFDLLKGKILANLFYEPSTRTSSSFTAAMERLGGSVIPINEVKYSSVSKGETLVDYQWDKRDQRVPEAHEIAEVFAQGVRRPGYAADRWAEGWIVPGEVA